MIGWDGLNLLRLIGFYDVIEAIVVAPPLMIGRHGVMGL